MKGIFINNDMTYMAISYVKSFNSSTQQWELHILYCPVDSGEYRTMEKNQFLKTFEHPSNVRSLSAS